MKKICILYTDSGAGHIAISRASKSVFEKKTNIQVEMVNFSKEYKVPFYSGARKSYKFVLKFVIFLQPLIVKFFDHAFPAWCYRKLFSFLSRKKIELFLNEHPADIYFSTYYTDTEIFKAIKKKDPKIKTVMLIADIMHSLRLWLDPATDLIIFPTQETYEMGLKYIEDYKEKSIILGLPVSQNIFENLNQSELKTKLGFSQDPLIFVAGGGEGMNQVKEIVELVDKYNKNISICVVCGKDEDQKRELESRKDYNNEIKIFGWVDNFPEIILASDLVITKAGPTTIWEVLTAGKKTILYGYIGGVEEGDVEFALRNKGVVFEKDSKKIAEIIKPILESSKPEVKERFKTNWAEKIVEKVLTMP